MHDFLLAKQVVDELFRIASGKKLNQVQRVSVEIGSIALSHDDFPEHSEEIDLDNLKFGIESLTKNTLFQNASLDIKKVPGDNWRIVELEGE